MPMQNLKHWALKNMLSVSEKVNLSNVQLLELERL